MEVELKLAIRIETLNDLKKFKIIENMLKNCLTEKFLLAYENKDGSAKQAIWNCAELDLAAFMCAFLTGISQTDREKIIRYIAIFPYDKANKMIEEHEL